jgi:hypothetical protein
MSTERFEWNKALRSSRRVTLLLVGLLSPLWPTLAQSVPESLLASPESQFAQPQELKILAELRIAKPAVDLNLVPGASTGSIVLPVSTSAISTSSIVTPSKDTLLLPPNSCASPVPIGSLYACLTPFSKNFAAADEKFDSSSVTAIKPAPQPDECLRWKAAFWQSFGFLVAGHAFRYANDSGARYLLLHKPFWHDYRASADHFNMSKWGDGDSFLVNYIGHPMEGAVFGYIFLNNDPRGRAARFGKSSNYWYSRLKAMAWATVWEAYFEIGPVFSEAAFGNEGGYTYVPGCGLYPCTGVPGRHYKPPTNNTGWVDFVITPSVGMGWIVMEDTIEREFVDRIAKGSPALKYKILRSSLAPSHTFANLFAGKTPWFRYPQQESFTQTFGAPLHRNERPLWKSEPRYSLGAQFISMNFPLDSESCSNCKQFFPGYGFDFNYRFMKYAYFDSVVNLFPGSGSYGQHGGAQEGLVGLKVGRALGNWGLFLNLRNGFIHYDKTLVPGSTSSYESVWRYAVDLGSTLEFYASRNSSFRINVGTTVIHYLQSYPDPNQPPTSVLSTEYYSFRGSPYFTTGYVIRF